jgi:ribosomal protein L22
VTTANSDPVERASAAPSTRFTGATSNARIDPGEARRALAHVRGRSAADALQILQFAAGHTCPPAARIVREAVTEARDRGLDTDQLTVWDFEVAPGESVVRIRRLAHGQAGWITTETTALTVELRPGAPAGHDQEGQP